MLLQRASPTETLHVYTTLPERFRQPRRSHWADLNFAGSELGCFLEGPAFGQHGELYVVDIPFGRIFRIAPDGSEWTLVTQYHGWPNGLKVRDDGMLMVADHKLGLVHVDPASGAHRIVLDRVGDQPLLGLNDLTIGPDGLIYTTDQGQTGMHDPRGRVLRVAQDGSAEVVLSNGPSPNGLVFDATRPWLYVAMTRGNAIWRVPLVDGRASKVGIAIQLSGGIGPDGLALDSQGNLLAAHPPIGVWQFDRTGRVKRLFQADDRINESFPTNLVVRLDSGRESIFVTDSLRGAIMRSEIVH